MNKKNDNDKVQKLKVVFSSTNEMSAKVAMKTLIRTLEESNVRVMPCTK